MYEPMISIVIPVYNGSNYVKEAIDSALSQTYKNYEVIVVNDGSCDDGKTENIVLSYGDNVRYIHKKNGGVATALNLGIRNMLGDYFAWLSHDDLLKSNTLETYVRHLQDIDAECILYGNYDLVGMDSIVYERINFLSRFTKEMLEQSVFPVINGCVNGCACLIHKSHFIRVGLFNEELKITQDNDMWFRIFRDSKISFCEEYLSSKRYHQEQDSITKNIYPDEDSFVYDCLKQLTLTECSRFGGTLYQFYDQMYQIFNDNKHPLVAKYCGEVLVAIRNGQIYERATIEELREIARNSDQVSFELKNKYNSLQREYVKYILRF